MLLVSLQKHQFLQWLSYFFLEQIIISPLEFSWGLARLSGYQQLGTVNPEEGKHGLPQMRSLQVSLGNGRLFCSGKGESCVPLPTVQGQGVQKFKIHRTIHPNYYTSGVKVPLFFCQSWLWHRMPVETMHLTSFVFLLPSNRLLRYLLELMVAERISSGAAYKIPLRSTSEVLSKP